MSRLTYRYSREHPERTLDVAPDLVALRTTDGLALSDSDNFDRLPGTGRELVTHRLLNISGAPHSGVEVFRDLGGSGSATTAAAELLSAFVRSVNPVLIGFDDPEPWIPTGNVHVRFRAGVSRADGVRTLARHGLHVKRIERFCWDWFLCSVPDERLLEAFPLAMDSYDDMSVVNSYPELLRRQDPSAMRRPQWHLYETEFDGTKVDAHIHAEEAWKEGFEGEGATIALIDDGFDTQHEEFLDRDNLRKVVFPVTVAGGVVRKGCRPEGPHGTRCAGVACANGNHGAFGVAPKAAILPVGCGTSPLAFNPLDVSLALRHAADCGADVVSCSWNPESLPYELPPMAQDALNYAADYGRAGRGSIVVFSAGNRRTSMDGDGYAAHPKAIAVAATNGENQRAAFSNFGKSVWCCAPGGYAVSTLAGAGNSHGIFTTDPMGDVGVADDYYGFFWGTSASAAAVAGVAALMIGAESGLTLENVKALLAETCDRIGPEESYEVGGHSTHCGFGRVNALAAAAAAST